MPAVVLDQVHWAQLEQVQLKVDGKVVYQTDQRRFGVADFWEPARKKGDCEDMALAKRARLIDMGWPADDLRIAVAVDERGALHAVLTVDVLSAKGAPATYVMDSRFLHVEPWKRLSEYGYSWVERARPGSAEWSRLDAGAQPAGALAASDPIGALLASLPLSSPARMERQ
jgi:predicted transglutaminase-like cysteine proteinase